MNYLFNTQYYTREEVAEILNLNPHSKNFSRDVKKIMNNLCYHYEYSRKGVLITRQPQLPEEKLNEILIRKFDMDIRTNAYAFGCFITELVENEEFAAMPWEQRAIELKDRYNIDIYEQTLRNWTKKLIKAGIISKDTNNKVEWMTFKYDGKIERYTEEEYKAEFGYGFEKYKELRRKFIYEYEQMGMPFAAAYKKAVFQDIFRGERAPLFTGHILYKCSSFGFTAFGFETLADEIEEIIHLCEEIAEQEPFELDLVEVRGQHFERVPVEKIEIKKPKIIEKKINGEFIF